MLAAPLRSPLIITSKVPVPNDLIVKILSLSI
jgi:hypothetical protein